MSTNIDNIICLVAKEIEKLCVKNTHNKVKGVVGVADNDKQGGLAVAYGVKLHFVGFHKVAQLLNVKGGKASTAAHEYAFSSLARDEKSRTF